VSRVVLKVGGAVAAEAADIAAALAERHEVCVVHGAGPQISADLEHDAAHVLTSCSPR
jgi:acetylglutamate kinase